MSKHAIRALARRQEGLWAVWQLRDAGVSREGARHGTARCREVHDGVFVTGDAPLTRRQQWWAAALTAPGRCVSHASGGAAFGFRPWEGGYEIVCHHGSGGPERFGDVLVCRSRTLAGHVTTLRGLPITTAPRTLTDLAPFLDDKQLAKAVREALRLRVTTCAQIQAELAASSTRNRPRRLSELARRYARLPIHRAQSDAESYALELLDAAGVDPPLVNVSVAGERPDLFWPQHRLIIELDGPDFHRFVEEDARKQRRWERHGESVRRLPTDDVFDHPERLLALAPPPVHLHRARRSA